ncbi:MAG: ATP-binding cassette domain-containing protein [Crocosphaera sp.]
MVQLFPILSGGQKQRVAIACALVAHPAIVLAYESTALIEKLSKTEIIDFGLRTDYVVFTSLLNLAAFSRSTASISPLPKNAQ